MHESGRQRRSDLFDLYTDRSIINTARPVGRPFLCRRASKLRLPTDKNLYSYEYEGGWSITSTRQTTTKRTFLGCCLIIIRLHHSSPLVFVLGNINNDCVRIYLPLLGDPFKLMCTFRCWYSWGHILGVVGCCVNHHPPIARIICF